MIEDAEIEPSVFSSPELFIPEEADNAQSIASKKAKLQRKKVFYSDIIINAQKNIEILNMLPFRTERLQKPSKEK